MGHLQKRIIKVFRDKLRIMPDLGMHVQYVSAFMHCQVAGYGYLNAPPKGGARMSDAGGRSASREQDVRVVGKNILPCIMLRSPV